MNVSTIKAASCVVTIAGCIQFVILTIVAMFTFPGGKHPNVDSQGYNFFENFFSDLGGTVTPNYMPNPVSSVLFFIALFAIGVMAVPFLLVMPSIYRASMASKILAWIGSVIGLIAAVAFIGVAFTPWNLYGLEHMLFVQVAFIGLIPLAFFYLLAAAFSKEKLLPRKYVAILIEFLVAAISYVVLLFTGPELSTPAGLFINAVGQKLIVYNSIVVIAFLAYGCLGVVRRAAQP